MRKSQAALEFLFTYGWALLALMVAIAALAYFGVFNPRKALPDRCIFKIGIDCQAYKIGSDGTFNLRLRNGLGETVTVTDISLTLDTINPFSCTGIPSYPPIWNKEAAIDFAWTGCNTAGAGFTSGNKGKIFIKISYYNVRFGSSYGKVAEGEVLSTVI